MKNTARTRRLALGIAAALLAGAWQVPAWAADRGPIREDTTLTEDTQVKATKSNLGLASGAVQADGTRTIDMAGHNLGLDIRDLKKPDNRGSGIYIRSKASLTIDSDRNNPSASNRLITIAAHGEWQGAGRKGGATSGIRFDEYARGPMRSTINADVEIKELWAGKEEVRGIWAPGQATLNLNGTFTIKPDANLYHYWTEFGLGPQSSPNIYGIHVLGKDNNINIRSVDVDHQKIQRGIQLGSEYDDAPNSTVRIGGGTFKVADNKARNQWLMWLRGAGKVYFGVNEDGTDAGTEKTVLAGSIHMEERSGRQGEVYLGLNGVDSKWTGGTEATTKGSTTLYLKNGATWDTSNGGRGTRLAKLSSTNGNEGHIFQNDKGTLTIDEYEGRQKIYYQHTGDGTDASHYAAGDTHIKKAAAGSFVTMVTDRTGVTTTDPNAVHRTLNALAGKLYYDAAKNGENKLTGRVMLAEGLTASSASLSVEKMNFSQTDGKGSASGMAADPLPPLTPGGGTTPPAPPSTALDTEQQIAELGAASAAQSAQWKSQNYSDGNGNYTFDRDVVLRAKAGSSPLKLKRYFGGNILLGDEAANGMNIDMKGHKLTLHTLADNEATRPFAVGIAAIGNTMEIKNAGGVDINISGTGRSMGGIYVSGKGNTAGKVIISNDNNPDHAVKIRNTTTGEKSSVIRAKDGLVDIKGLVDLEQEGDFLVDAAAGGDIRIGGGRIIAKGNTGGAVTVSTAAKVHINAADDGDGVKATSTDRDVQMEGNVTAYGENAVFGAALNTARSYLKGLIYTNQDTDHPERSANSRLLLANGARWENQAVGDPYDSSHDGSHVTHLTAHNGSIFQKDRRPLTIGYYTGTAKLFYAHTGDGTDTSHYTAGDTHIVKAATGSSITMVTDRQNVNTANKEQLYKTFNALAGKLYYDAAKNGENNLTGKAMIAEGLTGSSASVDMRDITFKSNGQGSVKKPETPPTPPPATGGKQIVEGAWEGAATEQSHWDAKGVRTGSTYNFQSDLSLAPKLADNPVKAHNEYSRYDFAGILWGKDKNGNINMNGHALSIDTGKGDAHTQSGERRGNESTGILVNGGTLTMNSLGTTTIKAHDNGIHLVGDSTKGNANLHIKNAGDTAHTVKIESKDKGIYLESYNGAARLSIDGMVDITAPRGIVVDGGELSIGGGKIVSSGAAALYVNSPGKAYINAKLDSDGNVVPMHEGRDVQIYGDVQVKAGSAAAHIGLVTPNSIFKGLYTTDLYTWPQNNWELAKGDGYLVLKNGGTWEHIKYGDVMQDKNGKAEVGDSRVKRLNADRGIIRQKDKRKIHIDEFRGNMKVIYEHENDGTKAADYKAGDVTIAAAKQGSFITMVTDNNRINMANETQVRSVLNALAGKLYYDGATSGLTNLKGKAMIAEGLTSSSAELKTSEIVFKKENGQGSVKTDTPTPPPVPQPVDTEDQIAELGAAGAAQAEKWKQQNLRDDAANYTFAKGAALHAKASTSPYAIDGTVGNILYKNKDGSIDMKGQKLTLTSTADSDTKRAGGIHLVGGSLTVKNAGAVDISISGSKNAASAIYAEGSGGKAANLVIKNGDAPEHIVKIRNTASGDKAAAIVAKKKGADARVTIEGLVDIEQEGADLLHADGGEIRIGGGTLIARGPNAKAVQISKGGKVYINAEDDGDGVKAVSDTRDVKVEGNIVVGNVFNGGTFGAALATKDSYIRGLIGTAGYNANTRLFLGNGARWINESVGSGSDRLDESHLTHLKANNGAIFQKSNKNITIDNFSGSAKLYYSHVNAGTETEDYGTDKGHLDSSKFFGETHIKHAAPNSEITMVTDSNGITMSDETQVRKTLNALASKLYYEGAKNGEKNLKGKASIAEGLTTSSRTLHTGDMAYWESNGRAYVKSTETNPLTEETVHKQIAESNFDANETKAYWKAKGVYDGKGNYTFRKNMKLITSAADNPVISAKDNKFGTIYWNGDVDGSIDMTGHRLDIQAGPGGHGLLPGQGPNAGWERTPNAITVYSGTLRIKNVKGMTIESDPKGSLYGRGIFVMGYPGNPSHPSGHGKAKLVIENDDDPANAVKIRVKNTGEDFGAIEARRNAGSAEVDIKGLVDIDSRMWRAIESHGARISIGGGIIKGKDVASIAAYSRGTVSVNAKLENGKVVATSNTRPVQITGDISAEGGGHVVLGLNNKNSFFKGLVSTDINGIIDGVLGKWGYNPGDVSMLLANGAEWEHKQVGRGYHHKRESNSAKGISIDSRVTRLQADKGILRQNDPHKLTIDTYTGNMKLIYQHVGDGTKAEDYTAGDVHIKKAEANSYVTMVTDSNGLNLTNETQVYNALNALAGKLYYDGYKNGERNLKGEATISEGLTASSKTLKRADMDWKESNGQGSVKMPKPPAPGTDPKPPTPGTDPKPPTPGTDPKPSTPGTDPKPPAPGTDPKPPTPGPNPKPPTPNPKPQPKIEYGDYETKLMSGVKSAMTASSMAWRAEANDLMKRMGDLRLSPEDAGIWARVYRGKSSSNKDNANFRMNYSTIQVGYDKKVSDSWRVGVAGSYMSGSSSYASGSGKNKEGHLGIYGTWTGKSGQYVDVIAKVGRLQNEYTVYNEYSHYVKGDFHTWGSSVSAEYGRRIAQKGGSFFEPQIEVIYSHLQGVNYVGSTDYVGQSMHVRQGAMNSLIGRLGLGFGQETERSTYFAKVSLYHEFAGDLSTDYSDGTNSWKTTHQEGKDTWIGVQLGGTLKLSDRSNVYGNFEKTFGGDIKTDWRVDAGIRWNF